MRTRAMAMAGLLAVLAGTTGAMAQGRDGAAVVPASQLGIKRIALYRSGVAAMERRGLIDGDARIQLRFTTDQINDILKSMFVLDLSQGQGRIDGISYGSREPLAKRLSSFGVDLSDNPAAGEILSRLRGTRVTLRTPEGEATGVVMNVETRPTIYSGTEKGAATKFDLPWINLLTDSGVRSFNLTMVSGFEIVDPVLAAELTKALAAVAEYRADRTKTVDISCSGAGAREVVVGYVQEAPAWKTSYRLVLPDPKKSDAQPGGKDRFTLQGWAIVENTTDDDWRDVTLSLVSGRPVSFQMDLYEPLYVFRPFVPVPTIPGVMPKTYAGGVAGEPAGEKAEFGVTMERGRVSRGAASFKSVAPAPATAAPGRPTGGLTDQAVSGEDMAGYAARSQAQVVEAGEVFQFELDHPVTIERQRSAMLPIVNAGVDGRRVSIYSAGEGGEHPMRGLEVVNSSGLQLMPGPISVFDAGAYAGDAQIGHVPAGDKRLLAYAVDLDVTTQRKESADSTVRKVRIVRGVLETTMLSRTTTEFSFANKDAARARTVVLEFPKWQGWELGEGQSPSETTQDLYRFEVALTPGGKGVQTVTQQRVESQTFALVSVGAETLAAYQKSGKISAGVMAAYQEAAKRQGVIAGFQREIQALEKERGEIETDQNRIRQNMNANTMDRQSDLYARYMKKLSEQENRIEAIATALTTARQNQARAQGDLDFYLSNLNVD